MQRYIAAALAFVCASAIQAQAPYLVKDINTSYVSNAQSSSPRDFAPAGSHVLFGATSDAEGSELFRSDGTTVELVKDIVPGLNGSGARYLVPLNATSVMFAAKTSAHGEELWVSDGTAAGTALVKDIASGDLSSSPRPLVAINGRMLLTIGGGTPSQLWTSDGTEGGTELLVGLSGLGRFEVFEGSLYFVSGSRLWKTDGTPGGTSAVLEMQVAAMTVANGKLLVVAWTAADGFELLASDGTAAGTQLVKDINPGAGNAFHSNGNAALATLGGSAVFFAYAPEGWALWRSDGTSAGTYVIRTISTTSNAPPLLSAAGQHAFYILGGALWRTDGTAAGTVSVELLSDAYSFVFASPSVYFVGRETSLGTASLWKLDTGASSAEKVSTAVAVGPALTVTAAAGRLWFAGSDGTSGAEPWVSDGTANATRRLANLASDPPASANPSRLSRSGERLFFVASDGTATEAWVSDGTAAGTRQVTSGALTIASVNRTFGAWSGGLLFEHSDSLMHVDGSGSPAVQLKNATVEALFPAPSFMLFSTPRYYAEAVWATDGTTAGTRELRSPEGGALAARRFSTVGPDVYFDSNGTLWRTGGTTATTVRLGTLAKSSYYYGSGEMVSAGGALYYVASSDIYGMEIARTEIGSQITNRVIDVRTGPTGSAPGQLIAAGTFLFFTADAAGGPARELWRTDGTTTGTIMLKELGVDASSSSALEMVGVNGVVFFVTTSALEGYELWKSDGTPGGTVLVADITPGVIGSTPQSLVAADGMVWFSADDGVTGRELWRSNGTPAGTTRVADIAAGGAASNPRFLTVAGRRLFFAASSTSGRELWALDLSPTAFTIDDARVRETQAGTSQLRFTITRSGDVSQPATIQYGTTDGSATAGVDYTAVSGTASYAAGQSQYNVDVLVSDDAAREGEERFYFTIASPSAGIIERQLATAVIEDDDEAAALTVALVPTSSRSDRTIVVTNSGPSPAVNVILRVTSSPTANSPYSYSSGCTSAGFGAVICNAGTLEVGQSYSAAISLSSYYNSSAGYAPGRPPGHTFTASVSSVTPEVDLSDNVVTQMRSGDGSLVLPPYLLTSSTSTITYYNPYSSSYPSTVRLTSSNPSATINPSPGTLPAGATSLQFAINTAGDAGTTVLSLDSTASMVVPIVTNPSLVKLDPVIANESSSWTYLDFGDPFEIKLRVAARRADGTYPTGTLALIDSTQIVIEEKPLDAEGKATFSRNGSLPGTYTYSARYSGDASFNGVTASLGTWRVWPPDVSINVQSAVVTCGGSVQVTVSVRNVDTTDVPAGTIRVTGSSEVTATLVPSGTPSVAQAVLMVPVTASTTSLSISYTGTGLFTTVSNSASRPITAGCVAMNLAATATASDRVLLTWTATGSSVYDVYRAPASGYYSSGTFSFLGYSSSNIYLDTTAQPGKVYLYRVRPAGGAFSVPDVATTIAFADDPIVPGATTARVLHLMQLRSALEAFRSAAGLPAVAMTTPPQSGDVITPARIQELRAYGGAIYNAMGLPAPTFTDPTLAPGMPVRAVHIEELRKMMK